MRPSSTSTEAPEVQVSVVIPTRNRLRYLRDAVRSVLGQHSVELELIVVDEASDDGTAAWLNSLASQDCRVRVLRHEVPVRLPGARNAGLRAARAPWVAFLDDDDVWAPDKLSRQLDELQRTQREWCYVGEVVVDHKLRVIDCPDPPAPSEIAAGLRQKNIVPGGGSGVLVSRAALTDAGGFDTSLVAAEDWECWLRLLDRGEPAGVLEPLIAYRWSPRSMSTDVERMAEAYEQVRALHPLPPSDDRESRILHGRYLAFQLARARQLRSAVVALWAADRSLKHLLLAGWVLVMRREWPTRHLRRLRRRAAVVHVGGWLSGVGSAS